VEIALTAFFADGLIQPLGEGWVLCRHGANAPIATLNGTGKVLLDLLIEGYEENEIASAFAQHFSLSLERAYEDVSAVVQILKDAGFCAPLSEEGDGASTAIADAPALEPGEGRHCGTFLFGHNLVRMHSAVVDIDGNYFSRFQHRAMVDEIGADVLELSGGQSGYGLRFRGKVIGHASTLAELVGHI
jgi:Coenzyme PQQ synthesis protein D (PqqD)